MPEGPLETPTPAKPNWRREVGFVIELIAPEGAGA